ncbi:hypothetical protein R3P38DRAFT_455912 [Favolaschia claudopus]|uniref:Uncharacterized protein n=1 Tax=Favolaschia claudopus TaxID=2862362 RepID=A0AAV9ZGE5_9AGAR
MSPHSRSCLPDPYRRRARRLLVCLILNSKSTLSPLFARMPNNSLGAESSLPTYLRSSRHLCAKLRRVPQTRCKTIRNIAPLSPITSIRSRRDAATDSATPCRLVSTLYPQHYASASRPILRHVIVPQRNTPTLERYCRRRRWRYRLAPRHVSTVSTRRRPNALQRQVTQSVPTRSSSTHFDVTAKCSAQIEVLNRNERNQHSLSNQSPHRWHRAL